MSKKDTQSEIDIIELQNECEKVKETLSNLKDQITATNVEAVATRREIDLLKSDVTSLRTTVQLLEKDTKYANEKLSIELQYKTEKLSGNLSPITGILKIIGTVALTAFVTAVLANYLIKP